MVNIFKFTEWNFDNCCQSKDVVDFQNLQGKLEPLTLKKQQALQIALLKE